jgi:hypothetical protein
LIHNLSTDFDLNGFVKPGAVTNTITYSITENTKHLTFNNILVFCGGANDVSKTISQDGLKSLTKFVEVPLHDILSGPKVKGSHPIPWSAGLDKAFEECKASLSQAALLAHPDPTATLALVTDASTNAMGAILQQQVQNIW